MPNKDIHVFYEHKDEKAEAFRKIIARCEICDYCKKTNHSVVEIAEDYLIIMCDNCKKQTVLV